MDQMTDEEYEAACKRGRVAFETEPHAERARYDRQSGLLILELYNGSSFSVPARDLQGLANASDDVLETVTVLGFGSGVHWESIDADFSVGGLLAGRFGTAAYMAPRRTRLRAILEQVMPGHRQAA